MASPFAFYSLFIVRRLVTFVTLICTFLPVLCELDLCYLMAVKRHPRMLHARHVLRYVERVYERVCRDRVLYLRFVLRSAMSTRASYHPILHR